MADLRVVFDSNVVVSAMLLRNSTSRSAFDLASTNGRILISTASIAELEDVLRRPKFDRYLTESERMEFLFALVESADLIQMTERVALCRDSDDDKYLEIAINGAASHIISGDSDLLTLHPFRGIPILTPSEFLTSQVP